MQETFDLSPMELWGGAECTINRVGDVTHEQLHRTGHHERLDDLDLFARLGIRALRYPILWERTAPNTLEDADWTWADERLGRLRELGVEPIVGLVHHGSGPSHTSLIDPEFPEKLADYARAVAERYPWVKAYTPINEPLTTARFSGLYGIWHPHGRERGVFAQVLLTQCRAVVLAMRAIREINPEAQLIQNEDICKVHATSRLQYEAEYQNDRRWLPFDLLCGRVDRDHPFWDRFCEYGIPESDLVWFQENACPPDIIGFDHYLPSERFLDHRISEYPADALSGNGRDTYVDVAATQVLASGGLRVRGLLRETWDRYHLPIAITEAHNGCTREEQMRWFLEVWRDAQELRSQGVEVRAVTAWALLGLFDWNSLVTCAADWYEPGVFDIRGPKPRATAMAGLIRDLVQGNEMLHPVLDAPGWWHRPQRFVFGFSVSECGEIQPTTHEEVSINGLLSSRIKPVLIVGTATSLLEGFTRQCESRGIPYRSIRSDESRAMHTAEVREALDAHDPWAVVYVGRTDYCSAFEVESGSFDDAHVREATAIASACSQRNVKLMTVSSDLVFDDEEPSPRVESDAMHPISRLGESLQEAELRVLRLMPSALVIRSAPLFGSQRGDDFLTKLLASLASGDRIAANQTNIVSPSYVPDVVHAALDLLLDDERGPWHLVNSGEASEAELVELAASFSGVPTGTVNPGRSHSIPVHRCGYRALRSERGQLLPSLEDAVQRYISECRIPSMPPSRDGETAALEPAIDTK